MIFTEVGVMSDLDMFEVVRSENDRFRVGIYPVAFGFRIRAWTTGASWCHLDWCAGGEQVNVERLYSILLDILGGRMEEVESFDDLPVASRIKPFFLDADFILFISDKLSPEFKMRKLPPVWEMKQQLMMKYA
jgi:hypothetical protein